MVPTRDTSPTGPHHCLLTDVVGANDEDIMKTTMVMRPSRTKMTTGPNRTEMVTGIIRKTRATD